MKRSFAPALGLVLALSCAGDRAFEDCRVREEHPRVLVAKRELPELAARVAPGGPVHEDYARFRQLVDSWLARGAPADPNFILAYAYLYLMERELGGKEHRKYAEAVKERIRVFAGGRERYMHCEYVAAWDWIYDAMTPDERIELGKILLEARMKSARKFLDQDLDFPSWYGTFYVQTMMQANRWLAIGLAFLDEGIDDETARRLYEGAGRFLKEQMVPGLRIMAAEDSGTFCEGFDYHTLTLNYVARTLEMWRTATGDESAWDNDWAKGQGVLYTYFVVPHRDRLVAMQDCASYQRPGWVHGPDGFHKFEALVAARAQDGILQHIVNAHSDIWGLAGGMGMRAWTHLLWKDPGLEPVRPEALPPSRLFAGMGIAVMREGWASPADCWAMLRIGDYYTGHQQVDCGMFAIHRKGDLALDSGWKVEEALEAMGQYHHWYKKTIAHNSLLVFLPGEEGERACTRKGTDNDGGQTYYGYGDNFRAPGPDGGLDLPAYPETGDMLAFHHTPYADYAAGDMTAAYSPRKVSHVSRRMLYLRPRAPGEPNLFLVFDRVVSPPEAVAREGFAKRWVVHCQPAPRLRAGGEWKRARDGVQEYSAREFSFDAVGGTHDQPRDKGGSLVGRVLLPEGALVRTVGGPGHEFWYNGRNHPIPEGKSSVVIPGTWRIEVEPLRRDEEDYFLHLLYPCDRDEELPETELEEDEASVRVSVRTRARVYRITFDRGSVRVVLDVEPLDGRPVEKLEFRKNL